jgi:hypothetical protein
VYTAVPLDYDKYLGYAGLKLEITAGAKEGEKKHIIKRVEGASELSQRILDSWLDGQSRGFQKSEAPKALRISHSKQ